MTQTSRWYSSVEANVGRVFWFESLTP